MKKTTMMISAVMLGISSITAQVSNPDNPLNINPTPHQVKISEDKVDVSKGFALRDIQGAFAEDCDFLSLSDDGLPLTINYGTKAANSAKVPKHAEAYALKVSDKGVTITGRDARGAYYGLQTLRQILEECDAERLELPVVSIVDYPEMEVRGTVEGFYGIPWTQQTRLDLIDFMGRNKMNCYVYGPKDDPYHRKPYWRLPYPEDKAANIRQLVEACRRARVNFVWAVHPGVDIRWDEADRDSLMCKLESMYDLGVRQFAVFFDDIRGDGADSHKQASWLNYIVNNFVQKHGDVSRLIVCPTDYNEGWANAGPDGQLAIYGRELQPEVDVFWTGHHVMSDVTPETLEFANSRIKRQALVWWNFPVNDYCRNALVMGPSKGLNTTLTSRDMRGIVTNPMEQGHASLLTFHGVADWAWNPAAYTWQHNWERAIRQLAPEAAEAFRTLCIHSTTPLKAYPQDESWESETFSLNSYSPEKAQALRREFDRMAAAPAKLRIALTDSALLSEIEPWLSQLEALGKRGSRAIDLVEELYSTAPDVFLDRYLANVMSPQEVEAYKKHSLGTVKMQRFYEDIMGEMLTTFSKLHGQDYPDTILPEGADFYSLRMPKKAAETAKEPSGE